jgi:hypothetical protein
MQDCIKFKGRRDGLILFNIGRGKESTNIMSQYSSSSRIIDASDGNHCLVCNLKLIKHCK